jgi:hypothetical protein
MQNADVTHCHEAVGHDVREAPAETLQGVEGDGAWPCTAGRMGGAGPGAVLARDDTVLGDGHFEDIRGEGLQGGVGVWSSLTMDMPGDGPSLWGDVLQQSSLSPVIFAERTGEG